MSNILHDAIAAARAGDMERAQQLAAENVRQQPDDANAWYLLSQLVDSDARRAAYLGKALALDPHHARARIEFDALPAAVVADLRPEAAELPALPEAAELSLLPEAGVTLVTLPAAAMPPGTVSAGEEIVTVAVAAADLPTGEVPAWLRPDDAGSVAEGTAPIVAPAVPELIGVDTPLMTTGSDVPGWAQPLSPEVIHRGEPAGAAEAAAVSAEYTRSQAPRPAPRPAVGHAPAPARGGNGGNQALAILFGLLVLLTLVVLAFLVYLLFF